METKTIGRELADFLCETFDLTFGSDMFYMRVPDEEGPVFWLIQTNGFIQKELKTKQKVKEYQFLLYYRDRKAANVDKKIFEIETILNRLTCTKLENYYLYSLKTSNLGTDEDVDVEGRYRGVLEIAIQIYDDYSK